MKNTYLACLFALVLSATVLAQGPCGSINPSTIRIMAQTPRTGSVYCNGGSETFSVQSTTYPIVLSSMVWTYGGTYAGTLLPNPNLYKLFGITTGGNVTATGSVNVSGTPYCLFTRTYSIVMSSLAANAGPDFTLSALQLQTPIGGATPATGGVSPYTYNWQPTTNLTAGTSSIASVSPIVNNMVYTLTVTDASGCTASDNMQLFLTTYYGELKNTLDAGYYPVINGKLYFSVNREYSNATQLNYKIFDDLRTVRADYSVVGTPALNATRGDNRYLLDLLSAPFSFTTADNNRFFTLEVTDEKNKLFLLKFKYGQ